MRKHEYGGRVQAPRESGRREVKLEVGEIRFESRNYMFTVSLLTTSPPPSLMSFAFEAMVMGSGESFEVLVLKDERWEIMLIVLKLAKKFGTRLKWVSLSLAISASVARISRQYKLPTGTERRFPLGGK